MKQEKAVVAEVEEEAEEDRKTSGDWISRLASCGTSSDAWA